MEPAMSTSRADYGDHQDEQPTGRRSVYELAREQGVEPIKSARDLVCDGIFSSDEELEAFLADVYALRHSDAG
jgi:hypothetical protein